MTTRISRLTSTLALAATTSLMLSGCIGVFEEQPARYNFVSGGKRAPLMNPGGQGKQVAEKHLNAAAAQQTFTPSPKDLTEMDGIPPLPTQYQEQVDLDAPASAEPSPLYYYEQQQAAIASAPLAETTIGDVIEQPVAMVEPSDIMQTSEASPLAQFPETEQNAFPTLANVPEQSPTLQRKFEDIQQNATTFEEVYVEETIVDTEPLQPLQANVEDVTPPTVEVFVNDAPPPSLSAEQNIPVYEPPLFDEFPAPTAQQAPYAVETSVGDISAELNAPLQDTYTPPPASVYDPAANTVAVSETPDVYEAPQAPRIYTSSGSIRLRPPKSIAEQGQAIQRSRYSDLRRAYSRGNLSRH